MSEQTVSQEATQLQPVTAESLTFRFQMLSESLDPRKTEYVITDLNEMLDRITSDEARSIHTELHQQKNEIETQTAEATAEPISNLQDLVQTQFEQNSDQINSAENQLDAARVLALALQPQLLQTQETLLQETIGQNGSKRQIDLSYINQAIGAVALRMVPTTK